MHTTNISRKGYSMTTKQTTFNLPVKFEYVKDGESWGDGYRRFKITEGVRLFRAYLELHLVVDQNELLENGRSYTTYQSVDKDDGYSRYDLCSLIEDDLVILKTWDYYEEFFPPVLWDLLQMQV